MAVKRYNPATNSWDIFPGTAGDDAYEMARINGYEGSKEEYIACLQAIPHAVWAINNADQGPVQNSPRLITAGGVWSAINNLRQEFSTIDLAPYFTRDEARELLIISSHEESGEIPAGVIIHGYSSSSIDLAQYNGESVPYSYIISEIDIEDWEAYQPIYKIGDWSKIAPSYTYKITWTNGGILVERSANLSKSIIEPDEPAEDPESIKLTISGTITYLDGAYYANKPVSITLISNNNSTIDDMTNENGYLSITQYVDTLPLNVKIIANQETKIMEVTDSNIAFGNWELMEESPDYVTRGQVVYRDGAPVANAVVGYRTTEEWRNLTTDSEGKFVYITKMPTTGDNNVTLTYGGETKNFNVPYITRERDLDVWTLNQYSEQPAIIATVVYEDGTPVNRDVELVYTYPGHAMEVSLPVSISEGQLYHTNLEKAVLEYGMSNLDIRYNATSVLSADMALSGVKYFTPIVDLGTVRLDSNKFSDPETSAPVSEPTPETGPTETASVEPYSLRDVVEND